MRIGQGHSQGGHEGQFPPFFPGERDVGEALYSEKQAKLLSGVDKNMGTGERGPGTAAEAKYSSLGGDCDFNAQRSYYLLPVVN